MSWTELAPPASYKIAGRAVAPVTLAAVATKKSRTLILVFRPAVIECCPWLTIDSRLSILIGAGDHDGEMRIAPGKAFRLGACGGRAEPPRPLMVRIGTLPGMPWSEQRPHALEYDFSDDWLQVTLPGWARPPREKAIPVPVPAAAGVPLPTKKNPFAVPADLKRGAA